MYAANSVSLIGRLGSDAILMEGVTKNLLVLNVAINRRVKAKDGTWGTETDWHDVAKFVDKETGMRQKEIFRKGDLVAVTGELRTRELMLQNGKQVTVPKIIAADISWLAGSPRQAGDSGSAKKYPKKAAKAESTGSETSGSGQSEDGQDDGFF